MDMSALIIAQVKIGIYPHYNNDKKKLIITADQPYGSNIPVDLCPKCVEEFIIWWSNICRDKLVDNPKENGNV